jgi:hypothetical protein
MGDMIEVYGIMRKLSKMEKRIHREGKMHKDIALIKSTGMTIEEKNNGEHLIIHRFKEGKVNKVNYWPSSMKWMTADMKTRGFTAEKLHEYLTK